MLSVPATDPSRGPRMFYGWYVLAASFAILFLNTGARSVIGVMVKPMADEFGWSRGEISAAVFLNTAIYAASVIVTGRLYDRFGPKWVIAVSSMLFAAGFALMATMHSLWQFLLYYGIVNAAGMGGITVPLFGSLLGHCFDRRRGLAVSLAFAGSCLGQFFLVPIFSDVVLTSGWRTTTLWIAVLTLAVNLPLAFSVIRGNPRHLGLQPFGSPDAQEAGDGRPGRQAAAGLSLSEAMHTRSLWLFTVLMFVCGAADFLISTHLVAMVTDYGVSPATGANMLAWLGLLSLGGILAAGPAADVIGNKLPIAITFALRIVLFAVLFTFKGPASFWVFSLGFGLTYLVTAPLTPTLLARMYGVTHLGFISGFVVMAHTLGGGLFAYLGGVIFDTTGNYNLALLISAAMAVVALICTLFIRDEPHTRPMDARLGTILGSRHAVEND
jgi:MFS family permease